MQEINWNNFKAKFNGKETKAFEYLCYLLFCREFDQSAGIFRYKNQAGIETEPIQVNGELVGFQSKFFDGKINQKDIIDSIEKAKTKNPNLDKIYFYLNLEFSESSKKDRKEPQYKVEIEDFARSKGVALEWRVPSHIEVQLSLDKNRALAQYFFGLEKGVIDFISELHNHSLAILKPIHSEIQFDGAKIKLDRSGTLGTLNAHLQKSPLVILGGIGGVGKTALIKDLYDSLGDTIPLFIFRATEFNVTHINELFNKYGNFTLLDFVREHDVVEEKYIVIDSAEKLSDLQNQEAFQEFLSVLLENKWRIIFTTRYSYLDNLKFQFVEVYRLPFLVLDIGGLELKDLEKLSRAYKFRLPEEERLLELLRIPFYLNEYLQNYKTFSQLPTLSAFRSVLWDKQIARTSYRINNTHLKRERCFLDIAKKRADSGTFFVEAADCADDILRMLEADEIIQRDSKTGGYFITHDIYEEWALDKFIEKAFYHLTSYKTFFDSLGCSLPIRRAFRNWLSEKLVDHRDEILPLIESSFVNDEINSFWKDEILVSVLFSDYSEAFFQMFEQALLEDSQKILMRAVFLLRIACKEIDEDFLSLLGLSKTQGISLKTVFTKPKGRGWDSTIAFLYRHKEEIGLSKVNVVIPLLEDWNNKTKTGPTTKAASLLGLYYFEEIQKRGGFGYGSRDDRKKKLIGIILSGSSDIKEELKCIFDHVVSGKERDHRSKYHDIVKAVLSSAVSSVEVAQHLPEQVINLADLFWFQNPDEQDEDEYRYSRELGVEGYFCIPSSSLEYFPASAFQTPIYQLLKFAPKATLDFILASVNRAVDCYVRSRFRNEVEEVEVFIDENETIKQYISVRLWHMYRGTQVSSHLLESIHMALERWLLEKVASQSYLEERCAYLLKNSNSASITAVVASVVLAEPFKLFNVARILFQTKEFFLYDTSRMVSDQSAKSLYSMGYGYNYRTHIYQDERMKTCDDEHRKMSLEQLAFRYQLIKSEEETEERFKERQNILWSIFDKHYAALPNKAQETEADKTWKLYLARMDKRKMRHEVEEIGGQSYIKFNPELEPELKQFSEDSLKRTSDAAKHLPLYLWSQTRFKREKGGYEKYQQYEDRTEAVISEIKEIIDSQKNGSDDSRRLLNASTPAYACSVLIRDFADKLSDEDKSFCKDIIVEFASVPFVKGYDYQIGDGAEPAILSLPLLIKYFPEEKEDIKVLLFLLLLTGYSGDRSNSVIRAIVYSLWDISFEDAQSLFLGYLRLKPQYEALWDEMRKEHFRNFQFSDLSREDVLKHFIELHESDLEDIASNSAIGEPLKDLELVALDDLNTAFELLPLKTNNQVHNEFVTAICRIFSEKLTSYDDEKIEYTLRHRFLEKLAYFILSAPKADIESYLAPFVDHFNESEPIADLFHELVSAEDRLERYEEFWLIWNTFYPKIVEIAKSGSSYHYAQQIIHNYLLAWQYWKEDAKEWHTLKDREKLFFKKVAQDMGQYPSVLYSLAKLLNEIGSKFLDEGIFWLSEILSTNGHLFTEELEVDTVYYLENIVRKYSLKNRKKIKTSMQIKGQITLILTFLVERGSVTGYLLREDVL